MSNGSDSHPRDYPDKYWEVRRHVESRLSDYQAWPTKIFQLECEQYGVYQNRTGKIINILNEEGILSEFSFEVNTNSNDELGFFTIPSDDPVEPTNEVMDATEAFEDLPHDNAEFSELTAYVVLAKVYDEIGERISGMHLLPKGRREHELRGNEEYVEPDAFIHFPNEYVPVEVHNGRAYLGDLSDKFGELNQMSFDDHPVSNPFMICRRGDDAMIDRARKNDGILVNTDTIVLCEDTVEEFPDAYDLINFFNLNDIVKFVPRLRNSDGEDFGGREFDRAALTGGEASRITPPQKMIRDFDKIPERYRKRIRGAVQLLYVNTFYRAASTNIEMSASVVLQTLYNQLLREGGKQPSTAMDDAHEQAVSKYGRMTSLVNQESEVREQAREYLSRLTNEKIVTRRNGNIYARRSEHPQQYL